MTALIEAIGRGLQRAGHYHDAHLVQKIADEVAKLDLCLGKVKPDEPIFVLRGQDMLAEGLVRDWTAMAYSHGLGDQKREHALKIADEMHEWPNRKYPD